MQLFTAFFIIILTTGVFAQSGRTATPDSTPKTAAATERSVKDLFDEASSYTRVKFSEYADKNLPYSERLQEQTRREQKQLAARNAAIASKRGGFAGDDLYFLGMLHWIADNLDGTAESLTSYVSSPGAAADKVQTARYLLAIAAAKQARFDDAEKSLTDYLANQPVKLIERLRIESELAKGYQSARHFDRMAPHAEQAYAAAKSSAKEAGTRVRALDEMLDTGMLVFEAYSGIGNIEKADLALDELRTTAKLAESPSFYYYAADKKITYMIDTGRKAAAMAYYVESLVLATKDFAVKTAQTDVYNRLKRRETHYKLLGEPAPEFAPADQWLPGKPRTLAELRGKVVFIDFWAIWCGPCIEAFPSIRQWQQEFGKDGLEILGVTRYYGMQVGAKDPVAEIGILKGFRTKHSLNYDFVIAKDQSIQLQYGAVALPTAVLIDRKGVIRYIATGTNSTRLEEIRSMIAKLIAER